MNAEITAAKLAEGLFHYKRKLKEMQVAHEAEEKKLKNTIADIEAVLAEQLHAEGLESVRVPSGTVGLQTNKVFKTNQLLELREFAEKNKEHGLLNISLSTTGVREYMQRHEGRLPPHVETVEFEKLYTRSSRAV